MSLADKNTNMCFSLPRRLYTFNKTILAVHKSTSDLHVGENKAANSREELAL